MGKDQRTLKHQHSMQTRSKFKSPDTNLKFVLLDDEPLDISQPITITNSIVIEKVNPSKCVKCKKARRQSAKAQIFASKRKGVRIKDEADKIIDAVIKMV